MALVSQSGGMSYFLGFMAIREDVGFSKIVGLGNRLNVDFSEMIAYFMDDPLTKVILLYDVRFGQCGCDKRANAHFIEMEAAETGDQLYCIAPRHLGQSN